MTIEDNIPNRFYVDSRCVKCGSCSFIAKKFFQQGEKRGYVSKQPNPNNYEEVNIFSTAFYACPVKAIVDREDKMIDFIAILLEQSTTKKV